MYKKRHKLSRRASKKNFKRHASKVHKHNLRKFLHRGGVRK